MDNSSSYLFFLASGIGIYGTMWLWRKGATRWNTWFPLLRKSMEWGLIGLMGALALYALYKALNGALPSAHALFALVLGVAVPELYQRFKGSRASGPDETQRGSEVVPAAEVAKRVKASKAKTFIEIGGVPIPESSEPYHFLIAGSTGTGKSVAINSLLAKIRERGDTAILVDSGGDFLSKHFHPETDFVFNPFDERCVGWSPTLEMQGAWDAQALARSIIPDGIGDSREWNSYAQTFVGSVLRKLWEAQRLTLADFLYCVQVAPIKELKELLEGTPAVSQMASEKMFGSIRTIASSYLTSYDYLPTDKEAFSLTQMIQAEHSGVLFVTYRDDQLDALRNIIASLLDVASRAVLSLQPDPNRRVWLIIDEFASIGRVQSVEAVATKARKAGGCLVLGIQSISQLKDRYGDNGAQTILSCLSSWLVLRCSDADTSEYMSRYIGEAEVSRAQLGKSTGDSGDSSSVSEQRLTKRVVLGSEIQQFENLHGLLKLAGGFPVCSVKLPLPPKPKGSGKPFVSRDFNARPLLKLTPGGAAPEAPAATPAVAPRVPATDSPARIATPVVHPSGGQVLPSPAGTSRMSNPSASPVQDALPARTVTRTVGVQVSTDMVERMRERQGLPKTTNLLVEASRGVPTLAERMRELERQRLQSLQTLASRRHVGADMAAPAAQQPLAVPSAVATPSTTPSSERPRLDVRALAAQAQARLQAARAPVQVVQLVPAKSTAPATAASRSSEPVSAQTDQSIPAAPRLAGAEAQRQVGAPQASAVQPAHKDEKTQKTRAQAVQVKAAQDAQARSERVDAHEQQEQATSKKKRRGRRGHSREDLGGLLR